MKKVALTQTPSLKEYLDTKSGFITYESFEDCYIVSIRDDQQLFWFGVGYGEWLQKRKQASNLFEVR